MLQVVGCSGAVFGFMGLYVADMALNFRSLSFPWLRLIWIGATLAYFVVASVTQVSPPLAGVSSALRHHRAANMYIPHESGACSTGHVAARGLGAFAWCILMPWELSCCSCVQGIIGQPGTSSGFSFR